MLSKEKLKIIDLKPPQCLENELSNYKYYQYRNNEEISNLPIFSPSPIVKSKLIESYPKNLDSYDIKLKKAPDIFPLNISQRPLQEDMKWKIHEKNFDIFESALICSSSSSSGSREPNLT